MSAAVKLDSPIPYALPAAAGTIGSVATKKRKPAIAPPPTPTASPPSIGEALGMLAAAARRESTREACPARVVTIETMEGEQLAAEQPAIEAPTKEEARALLELERLAWALHKAYLGPPKAGKLADAIKGAREKVEAYAGRSPLFRQAPRERKLTREKAWAAVREREAAEGRAVAKVTSAHPRGVPNIERAVANVVSFPATPTRVRSVLNALGFDGAAAPERTIEQLAGSRTPLEFAQNVLSAHLKGKVKDRATSA